MWQFDAFHSEFLMRSTDPVNDDSSEHQYDYHRWPSRFWLPLLIYFEIWHSYIMNQPSIDPFLNKRLYNSNFGEVYSFILSICHSLQ